MTEVIYDFVVTPPRAAIGLQRPALPERWRPLLYRLLTFSTRKRGYVTAPPLCPQFCGVVIQFSQAVVNPRLGDRAAWHQHPQFLEADFRVS